MRKKMVTVLLTLVVAASILGGCGAPQETSGRAEGTKKPKESEETREYEESRETQNDSDNVEKSDEDVFTSITNVESFSEAERLKEQTWAKNKEMIMNIIESDGFTDVQKQEAWDRMVEMTQIAEKEAAAEILLEARGFKDVVVIINGGAVDVVVKSAELTEVQRAQIEDIVEKKTDISYKNIIISTVAE